MRVANLRGRLCLIVADTAVDVASASHGAFGPEVQPIYEVFNEFREWTTHANLPAGRPFDPADLCAPVPAPRQVFAVGLNYHSHAEESGMQPPPVPMIFTKFVSSITGPNTTVRLPDGDVDWEVEVVVVVGARAHHVSVTDAWDHVAGLMVGQDLSERRRQMLGATPQFSLAKSFPGFTATGPWLTTIDTLPNPDDLEVECRLNGQTVQHDRSSAMIFAVSDLIANLSAVLTLMPGDIIFTGTPAGVGMGMSPQRFLGNGDTVTSSISGLGTLTQHFVRG